MSERVYLFGNSRRKRHIAEPGGLRHGDAFGMSLCGRALNTQAEMEFNVRRWWPIGPFADRVIAKALEAPVCGSCLKSEQRPAEQREAS